MDRLRADGKISLKDFLSSSIGISGNKSKELIDSRNVFVNGRRVWIASHLLKKNDIVEVDRTILNKDDGTAEGVSILFEDDWIIAVNKPPGIISNGGSGSLEMRLRELKKNTSIKAIHRLDSGTSGVNIFAKSDLSFEKYKELWQTKTIRKTYLAVSLNEAEFKSKKINDRIDGKSADTEIFLLKKNNGYSFFRVMIGSGRKHQIRIHLAGAGHPIAGDTIYGPKNITSSIVKSMKRQMLHAKELEFDCPFSGKHLLISAPVLKDFTDFLEKTGLS